MMLQSYSLWCACIWLWNVVFHCTFLCTRLHFLVYLDIMDVVFTIHHIAITWLHFLVYLDIMDVVFTTHHIAITWLCFLNFHHRLDSPASPWNVVFHHNLCFLVCLDTSKVRSSVDTSKVRSSVHTS